MIKFMAKLLSQKIPKKGASSNKQTDQDIDLKDKRIQKNYEANLTVLKQIYNVPTNVDVKFRDIHLKGSNKKACLIFIASITDTKTIEMHVLHPLLTHSFQDTKVDEIISAQNIQSVNTIRDILTDLNKGNAVLLIEGENTGYTVECSNVQSRSVDKAEDEVILKGPKEAFNEKAVTNISLIRKKIKNESLMVESAIVSKRSNNEVFLLYVKDLANEQLVSRVKKRLKHIDSDAIQNLGLLEQNIEDRKKSLFPTLLYTERPDRAASFLEDGYIVLLMDNSPASLIMPATFWSFFHNPEEHYLRFPYGNFTRLLRILAVFITLFTSATYVAITNFHSEMVPADLLLAIASTREKVPFPVLIEILIMELAFELIREAGLRVPSPIGPTIGIVGALILGQAAVEANIISPIIIIVVALGGLSSFAVSDISLNYTVRIARFLFIIGAGLLGIFGMTAVFVLGLIYMTSLESFGVPYLAPMTPRYTSSDDTIFRRLLQNERYRPGYVQPDDIKKR
ncbi:spore germination protein [Bacillus carboniphilus]|uniref:Spore germination protein n=2 Tax=Bacillus carboniphilus TaxID=86663 RepID=A0ABN0VRG5_9BACI